MASPGEIMQDEIVRGMDNIGEAICGSMRARLSSAGHVDTGQLLNSIHHDTERAGHVVDTYIYADSQSQDGAYYAEFIELGTGAAHGRPGGRVGSWRYRDRNGNWHTTDGMDADPFIEPAVKEFVPSMVNAVLDIAVSKTFDSVFDIAKYGRMKGGGSK